MSKTPKTTPEQPANAGCVRRLVRLWGRHRFLWVCLVVMAISGGGLIKPIMRDGFFSVFGPLDLVTLPVAFAGGWLSVRRTIKHEARLTGSAR